MNFVKDRLPALAAEELEAANRTNPPFHSPHEGYAVLLEEIEEAKAELQDAEVCRAMLWGCVKQDLSNKAMGYAQRIENHAINLAAEAIQIAAMARKFTEIGECGHDDR